MKIPDIITESLSRVAFHYTGISNAVKILRSGNFALSSSLGSVEQQYAPKGYNYFLSTTRTKTGNYHRSRAHSSGVIFVLDGNWFNNHYISRPIDYWENRNPQLGHHRDSEAEDRVFSREPEIPIGGVVAIHVLLTPDPKPSLTDNHINALTREILITAKTRGIQTFLYNDFNAWADLDTRKTVAPTYLRGQRDKGWYRPKRRYGDYMTNWIELMMKTDKSQLSKKADQMRYSLAYSYDKQHAEQALANDLSNARKPDSGYVRDLAVKIIAFMRQHRLNTVSEFVDFIAAKWQPKQEVTEVNFDHAHDPHELTIKQRFVDYFTSKGYEGIGEGRDQLAFESPRGTVLKVLGLGDRARQQAVEDYVEFFVQHQNNPFFPKIYNHQRFEFEGDSYFLYETEYLQYVSDQDDTATWLEQYMLYAKNPKGAQKYIEDMGLPDDIDAEQLQGLTQATRLIIDNLAGPKGYYLDLRQIENIRRRSDGHLVIVDPISL